MPNESPAAGIVDKFQFPRWSDAATEEDVYYCYRLLLDREPDPGGWASFTNMVSAWPMPFRELVARFTSSHEYELRHAKSSASLPQEVEVHGFRMYALPDDWAVGKYILLNRSHEPHVTRAIREVLRPGQVVVDIGANIGYFTLLAASVVGESGHVYAFEPNPTNCALIQLSLERNRFENVKLYPFALADKSRLMVLHSSASTGTTRPAADLSSFGFGNVIRAECLDKLLGDVPRIDVLKIDIDGSEPLAMRGAENILRKHRPVLFTEFSPDNISTYSGVTGEDYLNFLIGIGYSFGHIDIDDKIIDCGQDIDRIMDASRRAGASHIDLRATAGELVESK